MAAEQERIKKQDFYYWRLFATGFSFFNFGLGGLFIRFIISPLLSIAPVSKRQKILWGRLVIHKAYRLFIWQMSSLKVLTYETKGLDKLKPGQLIIANHPTLIDVCFLLAFADCANCIVKKALFTNPFTSGPLKGAGFIPNIEAEQLVRDCTESLHLGDSLIIFPEGTRTTAGEKPRLQRGAANIALSANVCPTPVTIKCSENTLCKGQKWYNIPPRRPHWTLEVGHDLPLPEGGRSPSTARALTHAFFTYFFAQEA